MDYADLLARIVGREESRETTAEYYDQPEQIVRRVDVKQGR
jgi:hypothetical protein